jgi:hypothetical protein
MTKGKIPKPQGSTHFAQIPVVVVRKIAKVATPPRPNKTSRFSEKRVRINDAEPI